MFFCTLNFFVINFGIFKARDETLSLRKFDIILFLLKLFNSKFSTKVYNIYWKLINEILWILLFRECAPGLHEITYSSNSSNSSLGNYIVFLVFIIVLSVIIFVICQNKLNRKSFMINFSVYNIKQPIFCTNYRSHISLLNAYNFILSILEWTWNNIYSN